jgi:predicted kinase
MEATSKTNRATLVLMVGGSGCGKTRVRKERYPDLAVVDCDDIKASHPDYDPKNPSALHEWSSREALKVMLTQIGCGFSVVYDSTGTNLDKLSMFATLARAAGMKVHAVYVTCSVETALRRNRARARSVSDAVVREKHAAAAMTWPVLRTLVDSAEVLVNEEVA